MKQHDKGAVKRYRQVWLWLVLWVVCLPCVQAEGIITTVAGNDSAGDSGDGGPATSAQLINPIDIAIDNNGNLYIADFSSHRIRKIDTAGIISTVAGNGVKGFSGDGGPAVSAKFNGPDHIALDNHGNLYINDSYNHRIRKINTAGTISTVAEKGVGSNGFSGDGGLATSAVFNRPEGVTVDRSGNLYIADADNHRIRKVDTAGIISTFAGNGTWGFSGDGGLATNAQLIYPNSVTLDSSDNIYIADTGNNCIRKVDTTGKISTIAGSNVGWEKGGFSGDGGPATSAKLHDPYGVTVDINGNLYIIDISNQRIRKVDTAGIISTVAGNGKEGFSGDGGSAAMAQLNSPKGIAVDSSGNLYIADSGNHRIRKVTFNTQTGGSPATLPNLNENFTGGIAVNGQPPQPHALLTINNPVEVTGNITVAPAHVGKTADIFVYVEATLPPAKEPLSLMLGEGLKTIAVWDKNPANLIPFQPNVTLGATQAVVMYTGPFVYLGTFKVFFGYRLQDGTMVASTTPITIITSNKGEPHFPGLVQLTTTDTDKMTLAWLPAQDDNTPPAAMTYQIHLSDQPNFTPSTATLHTAVTGQEKTEVTGLAKGHTYNVLVVAVDQDGNESVERDYRTATTFAEPVIVSQTTQFAEDKNLGLGEATTSDGVQFTYPSGGTPPQVGSVLFANVGEEMYLRKVDSVTPTADGGIVVQTSDAGLADVIEQGTIDTEMTSFDVNAEANRAGQRGGIRTSRSIREDGSQHAVMRWQDDVLVAEQENFNQYGGRTTRDSEQEIGGSANATFTPSLKVKFAWHTEFGRGIVITSGEVIARGQLSLDANAFYNFKGSAEAKKEVPLFEGVFRTRHVLGGIPFFLRWVVNVKAVFSASASSEIKANAGANATAVIEMGARYNPATDAWETLPSTPSFEKSFKAGIDLQGGVHGEVRIVPNVQVDLYRTLTANLSAEPFITADIAIQSIPKGELLKEFGYLPTQLSQFDLAFQMEGFVDLSLRFMTGFLKLSDPISLLDKTKIGELPKQMLFSLPELSVSGGSGKANEPITLTATTKDGTNNPFKEESVKWFVSPNKGTVSGGKTGMFTSGEEGSYTVFFSGHSYLGEPMARQFAVAEVSVGKGEDKCANSEETKGTFEFKWTGGTWKVYRGNEYTGSWGTGHSKVGLQEGSYTVKPSSPDDKSFMPFEITITKCQTTTVEMGGAFEFKWTGGTWKVYRGNEYTGSWGTGHSKVGLQEGSYTVKPSSPDDKSFMPFEITITKGQTTTIEMGGIFEFKWTGGTWKVYRGNEYTGSWGTGHSRVGLQEGSYTVKPSSPDDKSFMPFEITITKGQTTTIEMGGIFEFKWTGGTWKVYRGNEYTGSWGTGHSRVGLQEGSYTVKPSSPDDKSFMPFEITITKGQTTTIEMGGIFEFKWTGGTWKVYRGNEYTGSWGTGHSKVGLQEGSYIIKSTEGNPDDPKNPPPFQPFTVTITKGQTTTVSK